MLSLFQLLLAVFAIYSTLNFEEEIKAYRPVDLSGFDVLVSRVDRRSPKKKMLERFS